MSWDEINLDRATAAHEKMLKIMVKNKTHGRYPATQERVLFGSFLIVLFSFMSFVVHWLSVEWNNIFMALFAIGGDSGSIHIVIRESATSFYEVRNDFNFPFRLIRVELELKRKGGGCGYCSCDRITIISVYSAYSQQSAHQSCNNLCKPHHHQEEKCKQTRATWKRHQRCTTTLIWRDRERWAGKF